MDSRDPSARWPRPTGRRPSRARPAPGRGAPGAGRARSPLLPRSGHARRARTGIGGRGPLDRGAVVNGRRSRREHAFPAGHTARAENRRSQRLLAAANDRCSSSRRRARGRSRPPRRKNPHRGERWRGRESASRASPAPRLERQWWSDARSSVRCSPLQLGARHRRRTGREGSVMASSLVATPGDSAAGGERHDRPVPHDTQVDQLAQFVCGARFEDISEPAREQLKLRVLDSLGCALGALDGEPVRMVADAGAGVRRRAAGDADRRGQERAGPRGALQRRAGALPGLQRLVPRPRRDLPSLGQPRAGARRRRVCARRRPHAADCAGGRLPGAEPSLRGRAGARQGV